jgi:GntR family transcriptional regulator, histidine utilization repressor
MSESPYQAIKRSISEGITGGIYVPGQLLPSEPALSRSFGVARMTVNRAMRELAAERLVRRVPGVGTFVAEPIAQSGLVEIRNIADEIAERGHTHQAEVFLLAAIVPAAATAAAFGLPPGGELYSSAVLHCENDLPIQFEDRLVNPAVAPDYLRQDFSRITPNAYLMAVAPAQQVEHSVQAMVAPVAIANHLALEADEPCLVVDRRTWARDRLATVTRLYYPGSRFRLLGKFTV